MALWVPFANNNFQAFMTFKDMTLYFCFLFGDRHFRQYHQPNAETYLYVVGGAWSFLE